MLVAILANNFDPAYLWDIGREREKTSSVAMIALSESDVFS